MKNTENTASSAVKIRIEDMVESLYGITATEADTTQIYGAVAACVREEIGDVWAKGKANARSEHDKCVAYLSAEFLMGRALTNNLVALGRHADYAAALEEMGLSLDDIEEVETDAGLGNGGLGRLAACFLDSLATLGLPAVGYGILYENGFFKQSIEDGRQHESADPWLSTGQIWLSPRTDRVYPVRFGGRVEEVWDEHGHLDVVYHGGETVLACAYDMPVIGYGAKRASSLRLWKATSPDKIDFARFQSGDRVGAVEAARHASEISQFLYPNDSNWEGKALRLRQFYFLVSATMQSVVEAHKKRYGDLHKLPDMLAIQINDTHPALAIPELMRILVDQEDFTWEEAVDIAERTFSYTNHTVMPEALEKWPAHLMREMLPRIYKIIETLDAKMKDRLWQQYSGDVEKINRMQIIYGGEVRMANLCSLVCGHINGVSQLHGELLRTSLFRDFYIAFPEKFSGITNGITQRRWLAVANPPLARLVDDTVGDGFMEDWTKIAALVEHANDAAFQEEFRGVKKAAKDRFVKWAAAQRDLSFDSERVFDVQAKRLHEYKRQILKLIHIIALLDDIENGRDCGIKMPTTFIFAAKAAPAYHIAKETIALACSLSKTIKQVPVARDLIGVEFLPDYSVSAAEMLIPATDISEQISLAGTEASGTGNMKFMLNGAVTIGTMDGANVEMFEKVGADNIYIFGEDVSGVSALGNYNPAWDLGSDVRLATAVRHLVDGKLVKEDGSRFEDLYRALTEHDRYLVCHDFASYDEVYRQMRADMEDVDGWTRKMIANTAAAGFFSSDRTIEDYNRLIWHLS